MPEKIPTHFGFDGKPDDYSVKNNVWLLAVLNLMLWFGFLKIKSVVKNEIKCRQRLIIKSLTLLNLAVMLVFLSLNLYSIMISLDVNEGLGFGFYVSLCAVFVLPFFPVMENLLKTKHKKTS